MAKLSYRDAVRHWQQNDESKRHLDRDRDPEALSYGIYDDLPVWMNRYYAWFQRRVVERFLSQLDLRRVEQSLELGCGGGRWCDLLGQRTGSGVLGLDLAYHTLRGAAGRYPEPNFAVASAVDLPLASQTVDLAFAVTVLHHLPHKEQDKAAAEIARVLRPGGHFFCLESTDLDYPCAHLYPRPFPDWRCLLEDHGLEIVDQCGQEFLDFRRLTHPLIRLLKGESRQPAEAEAQAKPAASPLARRLFYLPFAPLLPPVWAAEWALSRWAPVHWAHYGCFLARRP